MFKSKKEPVAAVLHQLFVLLDIKITYTSVKVRLLQHPSFPSLFSITNTLTNFSIPNKAVKISPEQLYELETPFLATTFFEETLIVNEVANHDINYFSPSKGWNKTALKDFPLLWNSMVILMDTEIVVEEENYTKKRSSERWLGLQLPISLIFFLILITSLVFAFGLTLVLPYFLVKLLGLLVAILLVNKEINRNTKYSFCTVGKKVSCDDVLNSPASRIFSWLSMTDVGFLYFAGTVLAIIVSVIVPMDTATALVNLLVLTSFLSLPYTIFSLVYQAFIIRKWCILCLVTIAILWVEALVGYLYLAEQTFALNFEINGISIFVFCLASPAIVWIFLKNSLIKSSDYDALRLSHLRMTNNLEVFNFLQQKAKNVEMDFQPTEVILGNEDAPNILVIAINPYCPACGREYKSVLKLLDEHPDYARVIVRFVGSFHENDQRKLFTSAMLLSQYLKNSDTFQELLEDWLKIRDLNVFVQKYPMEHNKMSEDILNHHYLWSEKVAVSTTPTTYLNGKKLAEGYTLEQLGHILRMNNF